MVSKYWYSLLFFEPAAHWKFIRTFFHTDDNQFFTLVALWARVLFNRIMLGEIINTHTHTLFYREDHPTCLTWWWGSTVNEEATPAEDLAELLREALSINKSLSSTRPVLRRLRSLALRTRRLPLELLLRTVSSPRNVYISAVRT